MHPLRLIAETSPLDNLTSLGAAGLMGAMWLWERRNSQKRETQLDEAHSRIMGDHVQLGKRNEVRPYVPVSHRPFHIHIASPFHIVRGQMGSGLGYSLKTARSPDA